MLEIKGLVQCRNYYKMVTDCTTHFIVSCKISTLNFLYHLLFISSILIKNKIIAIFIAHIKFIWYICSEFENI